MPVAMELTEDKKVAVLLASLDEKVAASILQRLEPSTMARVAETIRGLGVIPGEMREKAIVDCVRGIIEMGNAVQGDDKTVNALLARAIGEKRAAALLQDRPSTGQEALKHIAQASPEELVGILSAEQPTLIAIALRYLPPKKSAAVMELLPSEARQKTIVDGFGNGFCPVRARRNISRGIPAANMVIFHGRDDRICDNFIFR